jgi:hypothetical protein
MLVAIAWFCPFDLSREINVQEDGRKLLNSGIAEAMLSFDEEGVPRIEPEGAQNSAGLLGLMGQEDVTLLQEEYRRSGRSARLKLRGFKATILGIDSEIEVYLLIHKTGFAVLSFWLFTDKVSNLNDIIRMEDPHERIKVREIWPPLLDRAKRCKIVKIPEGSANKAGKDEEYAATIEVMRNIYICFVQTTILGKASPCKAFEKKLRYPFFGASPMVAVFNVDQLDKFLDEHRKELFGILSGEKMWDSVREEWVGKLMERNLAWREGWGVYIERNRALLVISKEASELLKAKLPDIVIALGPPNLLPGLYPPYVIMIDKERVAAKIMTLDLAVIMENLMLQKIMLRTYDYILGRKMPRSIRKLTALKEEISNALEEFLNVRVWNHLTATEWVEYGKRMMGIDEMYESIRRRLELVESTIRTLYDKMFNWLIFTLTVATGFLQILEPIIHANPANICCSLIAFTVFLLVSYWMFRKFS